MAMNKLPYKMLGGVVPCPGGWLIVPARLAGVTVVAEDPMVVPMLIDVLEFKPKFEAAAIHVPIGFSDSPEGPYRPCDDEAREFVGWPRRVAVRPTPSRAALNAPTREAALAIEPWLTRDDFRRFKWIREAEREFQPFHQRSFFAAHPDLTFSQMNNDQPLRTSPYHEDGVLERLALIRDKMPGVDEIVTRSAPPAGAAIVHLLQATGLLWTARRAAGRAMQRLPMDPTWDSTGMRMELVR
jgi:predicted RNase H-like nuclease